MLFFLPKIQLQRLLLVFAPLPLIMLGSCANSQFGEQLAESFDSQAQEPLIQDISKPLNSSVDSSVKKISSSKDKKLLPSSIKLNRKSDKLKKRPSESLNNIPFTPQPYRITIKLSGANPSAPAELVTKALRKAGVSFEVERIERVDLKDGNKEFPAVSASKTR